MSNILERLRSRSTRVVHDVHDQYDDMARQARSERMELQRAVATAEQQRQSMDKVGDSVSQIKVRLAAYEARREHLEAQLNSTRPTTDLLDTLETRTRDVENATGEFEQRLRLLARQIVETENARDDIEHLLAASRDVDSTLARAEEHEKTVSAVEIKIGALADQLNRFEGKCSSITERHRDIDRSSESLSAELSSMRKMGEALTNEFQRTRHMAAGIDDMLTGLHAANTLAHSTGAEIDKLTALSEQVSERVRGLSATKQALERAEADALRVNDIAWQIGERAKEIQFEYESVHTATQILASTRLDLAELDEHVVKVENTKRSFQTDSDALLQRIGESSTRLHEQLDLAQLVRDEIGLINESILTLDDKLHQRTSQVQDLAGSQETLTKACERTEAAISQMHTLHERVEAVEAKTNLLSDVEQRLADVATLSLSLNQQLNSLDKKSQLVDTTKDRISDLEFLYEEIEVRFRHLRHQREDVEATLLLLSDFRNKASEAHNEISEVAQGLSKVDQVRERLVEVDAIAAQTERRARHLELTHERMDKVERQIEASQTAFGRVENLNDSVVECERRLAQITEELATVADNRRLQSEQSFTEAQEKAQRFYAQWTKDMESAESRRREISQVSQTMEGRLRRLEEMAQALERKEQTLLDLERFFSGHKVGREETDGPIHKLDEGPPMRSTPRTPWLSG